MAFSSSVVLLLPLIPNFGFLISPFYPTNLPKLPGEVVLLKIPCSTIQPPSLTALGTPAISFVNLKSTSSAVRLPKNSPKKSSSFTISTNLFRLLREQMENEELRSLSQLGLQELGYGEVLHLRFSKKKEFRNAIVSP